MRSRHSLPLVSRQLPTHNGHPRYAEPILIADMLSLKQLGGHNDL